MENNLQLSQDEPSDVGLGMPAGRRRALDLCTGLFWRLSVFRRIHTIISQEPGSQSS
jgi:hypothetical protein